MNAKQSLTVNNYFSSIDKLDKLTIYLSEGEYNRQIREYIFIYKLGGAMEYIVDTSVRSVQSSVHGMLCNVHFMAVKCT